MNCKLLNNKPHKILKENAKVIYSMRYIDTLDVLVAGFVSEKFICIWKIPNGELLRSIPTTSGIM